MAEFVEVQGLDPLVKGLEQFDTLLQDELAQELTPLMEGVGRALAAEPPERPGQRYQRTHNLSRGWTDAPVVVERAVNRIRLRKTNPTPYGPLVQRRRQQASVHRGRWTTVDEAANEASDEAQRSATRAARRALGRIRRR